MDRLKKKSLSFIQRWPKKKKKKKKKKKVGPGQQPNPPRVIFLNFLFY